VPRPAADVTRAPAAVAQPVRAQPATIPTPPPKARKTDEYYELKTQIFGALIDTIDLSQLSKMDMDQAREEIRDIVQRCARLRAARAAAGPRRHR
jgi:pilus assembly protein CpaF